MRHKLARANALMVQAYDALVAFQATSPCRINVRREPATNVPIYFVSELEPVPPAIPLLIGDALHNFRSTLDHLAYQLVLVGLGTKKPQAHVYFPIARDLATYQAESPRKTRGMSVAAKDAIDALEPYGGGKGAHFWGLHELENTDKHRLILPTVAGLHSINVGEEILERFKAQSPDFFAKAPEEFFREAFNLELIPAGERYPLNVGDEVYRGDPSVPSVKLSVKYGFVFGASVLAGQPIPGTIKALAREVERVVTLLEAFVT